MTTSRSIRRGRLRRLVAGAIGASVLIAACGGDDDGAADGEFEPRTVRILANWLAQASQGGYWQAAADGLAEDAGVTITGISGGPGIATVTNVAIGEAEYGMTASDNILMARAEEIPVVAVWGGMDVSPQCFMSHTSAGVETFEDLNGMKISVSPVGTFWPVIKAKFDIQPAEELPVVDFATFLNDDQIVRQCFNISEAFLAQEEGWDVSFLMVHESGFQTNGQALFTTEQRIREHPEEVAAVVAAVEEGWRRFLEGEHQSGVDLIIEENPDYTFDEAEFAIEIMRDELFGEPLGDIDPARWQAVYEALREVDLISEDIDWEAAFTTEFLPER